MLILLVRLTGLEPVTYGLEVRCSIQLSYRRIVFCVPDLCAGYRVVSRLCSADQRTSATHKEAVDFAYIIQ